MRGIACGKRSFFPARCVLHGHAGATTNNFVKNVGLRDVLDEELVLSLLHLLLLAAPWV